jgi:hypothetical protein
MNDREFTRMFNKLTPQMRTNLRSIHDGYPLSKDKVRPLVARKLVYEPKHYRTGEVAQVLTKLGERAYTEIMSSGDGPEDLKAKLSFGPGFGRVRGRRGVR